MKEKTADELLKELGYKKVKLKNLFLLVKKKTDTEQQKNMRFV